MANINSKYDSFIHFTIKFNSISIFFRNIQFKKIFNNFFPPTFDHRQFFFGKIYPELCNNTASTGFGEGRSTHDKTKLYIGKSNRAVILTVDEEKEKLKEKVREKEDHDIMDDKIRMGMRRVRVRIRLGRRIGMIVMMALRWGWTILSKKLSTADKSAFLQLIGKLSLSEKIDLGIIEKLSLSKICS